MPTLHVAYVALTSAAQANAPGLVRQIYASEAITTANTGSTQTAGASPDGATHAICVSVDANHYVNTGSNPSAGAALASVCIPTGSFQVLPLNEGEKVAARSI